MLTMVEFNFICIHDTEKKKSKIPTIAGAVVGVIGSIALIATIAVIAILVNRRKNKKIVEEPVEERHPESIMKNSNHPQYADMLELQNTG